VFSILRSLLAHRRLLKDFVVRDLKARYVGSTMGFFWSVVFPIINLFVYMFVFRVVLKARWSDTQGALEVAIVMLAGIVVWTAFAETISRSTNTLVDNSSLIQKVVFPAEILPCYLTLSSLVNMCIGLPVVLLAVFWFGHVSGPEVHLTLPHEAYTVMRDGEEVTEERAVEAALGEAHEPYSVRVHLTRGWHEPVRIPFTLSGTAVEGEDYLLDTRELVIEPGTLHWNLNLVPLRDRLPEERETIVVELGEPDCGKLIEPGSLGAWEATRLEVTLVDAAAGDPPAEPPPVPPTSLHGKRDPTYHPLHLGPTILALPLLFLLQVAFTVGLGYFLAAFNLFLRDTFHLVGVAVTVWMFSTPIFYPGHLVAKAGYGFMLVINPMHWLIDSYRRAMLHGLWPEPEVLVQLALAALFVLLLGGGFFRAHKAKFPDLL